MKFLLIGLMSFFLASCSTIFGVPQSELDTANKNLAAATIQITSVARLTTSLVRSGALKPAQGKEVTKGLQNALDAVTLAKDAVKVTGDPAEATNAIDTATTAIELAIRLLSGFTGQDISMDTEGIQNEPYIIGARRGSCSIGCAFDIALA